MSFSPRDLIRILEKNGFAFKRSKGSHHLYENSNTGKTVVVPLHGKQGTSKGNILCHLKTGGHR